MHNYQRFVFPQDQPDGLAGLARAGGLTKLELAAMMIFAMNPGSARTAVTSARALIKEIEREDSGQSDTNNSGGTVGKRS